MKDAANKDIRDTASAEGTDRASATDEWQSVEGDTTSDIRQPYLEQSGKTDECDTTSGKCTGAWQKKRHAAGTDV